MIGGHDVVTRLCLFGTIVFSRSFKIENAFTSSSFKFKISGCARAKPTTGHSLIMESISRLRGVLLSALGSRGLQHGEQELFDELMVNRLHLLNLFDVGPRSMQEQREMESGGCHSQHILVLRWPTLFI